MTSARKLALNFLYNIYFEGAFSNVLLNSIGEEVDEKDKRLIRELVYGVIENDIYLEYIVSELAKSPIKNQRREILLILKMAIYQIRFLDRIPERAAIYEAVELARDYDNKYAAFVNGLLREYIRSKDLYDKATESLSKKALSLKYSVPSWIINYWIKSYSIHEIRDILNNMKNNSLFIRVNPIKASKDKLKKSFDKLDIEYKDMDEAFALAIKSKGLITKTSEYKNGYFSIQDITSQRIPNIMDLKEGLRVLDLCSAPGGKSLAMAESMKDKLEIVSADINEDRLKIIEREKKRLGIRNIKTIVNDASKFNKSLGTFDRVLLDAPCSGLGTMGKKPEIKLRLKWRNIEEIAKVQFEMLNISKNYVKSGGLFVYSTCTISKIENEDNVVKFLSDNEDFKLESFDDSEEGMKEFLPNEDGSQGFFIAKMRRK